MHFSTMMHNATRGRAKSVQFEKSFASLAETIDGSSSRDGAVSPVPVPGTRTSSLPLGENNEMINKALRRYKSLLEIEDPAPKLPMTQRLSYDELYPKATDPTMSRALPSRRPWSSNS